MDELLNISYFQSSLLGDSVSRFMTTVLTSLSLTAR